MTAVQQPPCRVQHREYQVYWYAPEIQHRLSGSEAKGFSFFYAQTRMYMPVSCGPLLEPQEAGDDVEEMVRLENLIDTLEENDDVERVYTTLEQNHLIADTS